MTTSRLLNYLIFIQFSFAALSLTACGIDLKHAERLEAAGQTFSGPPHPPPPPESAATELETRVNCGTLVGNGDVLVMTENGPQLITVNCPYRPKTTT